jgi:hypothetical protein
MHPYLVHTGHATEHLFEGIFREERLLTDLQRRLASATPYARMLTRSSEGFLSHNYPNDDEEGIGQLRAMEAWDARNETSKLENSIEELNAAVAGKEEAMLALCGAVLQIAKFGITAKSGPNKGKLNVSKPGRLINGLRIEEIIWAARNQSMHHESAPTHQNTKAVFDHLFAVHGPRFDASKGKDLSRDVLNLLDWSEVEKYEGDMEMLLP